MSSNIELDQDFALQFCNTPNSFLSPRLEIRRSTSYNRLLAFLRDFISKLGKMSTEETETSVE